MPRRKFWYAVMKDDDDTTKRGSWKFREAREMLEEQGHGLIKVIDTDFHTVETIYRYEELY